MPRRIYDPNWPPKPGEVWEAADSWGHYDKGLPVIRCGDLLLVVDCEAHSEGQKMTVITASGLPRKILAGCGELNSCNLPTTVV